MKFALLFVGGAGCYEVLRREPMLSSRIYAHVRFAPMTLAQVVEAISVYHDTCRSLCGPCSAGVVNRPPAAL